LADHSLASEEKLDSGILPWSAVPGGVMTPKDLWELLMSQTDAITEVSAE
jgi:hypothetical protein